jgi:hypothetical protein
MSVAVVAPVPVVAGTGVGGHDAEGGGDYEGDGEGEQRRTAHGDLRAGDGTSLNLRLSRDRVTRRRVTPR